ncbi:MAG: hypothetical protein ABH816_03390 [Candidatus Levyibacteriota bacterium]
MNSKILIIVVAIVIAAGSFFGGMQYQKSRNTSFLGGGFGQGQNGGFRQGAGSASQNFRPINGEILSIDDKSMTVKLADDSSKIVILASGCAYLKTSEAAKSDLKVGEKVTVLGTQNSDGSVTAQNVQIGSAIRGAFGGQGAAPKQ